MATYTGSVSYIDTSGGRGIVALLGPSDGPGLNGRFSNAPAGGKEGAAAGDVYVDIRSIAATQFGDGVFGTDGGIFALLLGGGDVFDNRGFATGRDVVDAGPGDDEVWTGDGGDALGGGDAPGVEERLVLVVDADAHLHRQRQPAAGGLVDGGVHDPLEEPPLVGQRRPAAATGDLGDGAAEVQVDVVGEVLVDDHPHRGADDGRVDTVELQRAR